MYGKYECRHADVVCFVMQMLYVCVSCVYPVAVLNAAFCMTCSLLMLVEDARGDHMEEAYSRAGLMTAVYVDLQYDEISIAFTAGCVSLCCVCSHDVVCL